MDEGLRMDDEISDNKAVQYYIEKLRAMNEEKFLKTGRRPLMLSRAFGCQMNARDSEKLEGMLTEMGYGKTDSEEEADFIIYNTCCVRENAENKIFGNLGYLKHLKESKPHMKIVLCGCMTQQDTVVEKIRRSYSYVDVIFGTFNIHRFPALLVEHFETGHSVIDIWNEHEGIVEDLPTKRQSAFKAGINIMYGCNNFCSYCIVPYVRGRERSRNPEDIIREAEALAADGVKELLLLGQNVNSYGANLGTDITFASLLRKINNVNGIERIRFMTSHPKDLSDELIDAMAECDKVCRHLHLPIQSGSNEVLKKMNRKYTKEEYMGLLNKIRAKIPDLSVTTDIIVGFPGETDENFRETLELVRQAAFAGAFTFQYSVRTGTPAAKMEGKVSEETVKARFGELLSILNPIILEINKAKIGKTLEVLAEEVNSRRPGLLTGRTDDNSIIHFEGEEQMIGKFFPVEVTDCRTFYLNGALPQTPTLRGDKPRYAHAGVAGAPRSTRR